VGGQAGRDPEVPGWDPPPGSVKRSLVDINGYILTGGASGLHMHSPGHTSPSGADPDKCGARRLGDRPAVAGGRPAERRGAERRRQRAIHRVP
jgi:hypothetical protein